MPALLELQKLSKTYQQGKITVKALNEFSLGMEQGDFVALCGPSGSGKTTCLNLVGGLDKADGGSILLQGQDICALSQSQLSILRRDKIGFVFQAYNLIPVLTALENTEFIMALQGLPVRERRERAMKILADVGLQGLESRRPDELSGGQQQRVAIARAIVHEPAIVLADEPTANLDSANAESLLNLMQTLNKDKGVSFLFSTHDPRVMQRARRLVWLKDGMLDKEETRA
jgi:putative ABC transport system ATP-binding protein